MQMSEPLLRVFALPLLLQDGRLDMSRMTAAFLPYFVSCAQCMPERAGKV